MSERGNALMGAGHATGPNRAYEAAQSAVSSPLLDDISISGAEALLVNVTGGESMTLHEINEAVTVVVDAAGHDANVIFGAVIDENMGDGLSITVIATGFGKGEAKVAPRAMGMPAAAHPQPRIYPMGAPSERMPRPAAMVAPPSLEEASSEEETIAPPARTGGFRMAGAGAGTPRRPFGGRAITRENMDVPAFMRKQMD
jgi:cell division protein FtsZ